MGVLEARYKTICRTMQARNWRREGSPLKELNQDDDVMYITETWSDGNGGRVKLSMSTRNLDEIADLEFLDVLLDLGGFGNEDQQHAAFTAYLTRVKRDAAVARIAAIEAKLDAGTSTANDRRQYFELRAELTPLERLALDMRSLRVSK